MADDKQPSPANGALRCGSCERKLVIFYLASIAEHILRDDAPGSSKDRATMSSTLKLAARSIENGVHEVSASLLPGICPRCARENP